VSINGGLDAVQPSHMQTIPTQTGFYKRSLNRE